MVRGIGSGHVQKVQLTVRFENGKRSSIILGPKAKSDPDFVPWGVTSAGWILNVCKAISLKMESENKNLDKAYGLVKQNQQSGLDGTLDWEKLSTKFKIHKTSTGKKGSRIWNRNYRTTIDRTLLILASEPPIASGYSVLKTLVERHGGAPGSASRRLRVQYAAEFLRFAFRNGAKKSCLPPEDLNELIGEKVAINKKKED
ncbi:putative BRCA1 C Terminus (BRCT) domain [Prochlorococcus marinus str. SS2]|nr:putative BRCA1 C Terminus (BRCT) domain [Prochlorococcus marinus str. SS2]